MFQSFVKAQIATNLILCRIRNWFDFLPQNIDQELLIKFAGRKPLQFAGLKTKLLSIQALVATSQMCSIRRKNLVKMSAYLWPFFRLDLHSTWSTLKLKWKPQNWQNSNHDGAFFGEIFLFFSLFADQLMSNWKSQICLSDSA